MEEKKNIPNSIASMVLGIVSCLFSLAEVSEEGVMMIFVGLVAGIIGIALSNIGKKIHQKCPEEYKGEGILKAGKITSIVGTCLCGLGLLGIMIVASLME